VLLSATSINYFLKKSQTQTEGLHLHRKSLRSAKWKVAFR